MTSRHYWTLAAYYGCFFAVLGIWLPYWPLYLESVGISHESIGVLTALTMGLRMLGTPFWGHLADRRGRALVIISTAFASAFAFSLYFWGTQLYWLIAVTAFYGFVHAAAMPLVDATAMETSLKTGGDYGRVRVWGSIGFIVCSVALGALVDWRGVAIILPVILGLLIVDAFLTTRMPRPAHTAPHADAEAPTSLLRDPAARWFYAGAMLMQFSHAGYYGFYSIHLEANGYSRTLIGALWALGVIAEVAVLANSNWILKRFGVSRVLLLSLILASLRWSVIGATLWLPLLLAAQLLHAFTFGSFHVASVRRCHDLAAPEQRGSAQAWYSAFSFGVGGSGGLLMSGFLYGAVGSAALFAIMSLAAALGVIASLRAAALFARRAPVSDH
ncbi:MFS transporter [Magnetofaba australis]|uniref:Putative major facilitator superfamily transporter n=1 Tax=Magnetofaba australis IT-1 TaxID=1434232 RepID=A0A1Y2K848_9PROT|nr:MFS transporter [Magnetofaba australis]OSM06908.1 putative major facilitator superfamily transporter [Magnetofaba australis IT-1]